MQNKFGPAQLPHLSQWLASSSVAIIKSYHNLKYQKFLERELLKINKNGKLHELCDILENEEARNKDKANYTKAVSDINFLLAEKTSWLTTVIKWMKKPAVWPSGSRPFWPSWSCWLLSSLTSFCG